MGETNTHSPQETAAAIRRALLSQGSLSHVSREVLDNVHSTLTELLLSTPLRSSVLPLEVVGYLCALAAIPQGEDACTELVSLVNHSASRAACVNGLFDIAAGLDPSSPLIPQALRCYRKALDHLVGVTESSDASLLLLLDHANSILPHSTPLSLVQSIALPYIAYVAEAAFSRAVEIVSSRIDNRGRQRQAALSNIRGKLDIWETQALILSCSEWKKPVLEPLIEACPPSSSAPSKALFRMVEDVTEYVEAKPDITSLMSKVKGIQTLVKGKGAKALKELYQSLGLLDPLIRTDGEIH